MSQFWINFTFVIGSFIIYTVKSRVIMFPVEAGHFSEPGK